MPKNESWQPDTSRAPKGRPRKEPVSEEAKKYNEIVKLRMQVELLRNFLSEAGRRRS